MFSDNLYVSAYMHALMAFSCQSDSLVIHVGDIFGFDILHIASAFLCLTFQNYIDGISGVGFRYL
uniref:Uncharacterized protein n=1 Tax=Octopus bimaculoides TaxID=37653 RepID=A0A0L8GRM6_OCTBM